jgi:hypothetical protein
MSATITLPTPDWLARRDGELRRGIGSFTWLVLLSGSPQYRLDVVPAKGRFSCAVTQAVNGKRLDPGTDQAAAQDAFQAGLEKLREALGW